MVSLKQIKTLTENLLIIPPGFTLKLWVLVIFAILITPNFTFSQIKIYERPPLTDKENAGLSFFSNTRTKIDLTGRWDASFNNGESFSQVSVPIAYEYKGKSIFKRQFSIPQNLIGTHSFILVAEGINYESSIRINNVFLLNHKQGFTAIIIPIEDEIIREQNEIEININNDLTTNSTIPLADQLNFSRIYGGINKDIYLIAVPKVYTLQNSINYNIEGYNRVALENLVTIKSSSLEKYSERRFTLISQVIEKSTGQIITESSPEGFIIDEFSSISVKSTFSFDSPKLWSFESPNLYIIKSIISDSGGIIDEKITEIGIRKVQIKSNTIFINGKEFNLKGINYYEDSPAYASALNYYEVERDLRMIKDLGINCIRVPGRTPHPYIVNLCNQLGLFLFAEIPFNEVPHTLLKKENYVNASLDYLSSAISQYKNDPCILAWGIGNDFDVTKPASSEYVKLAKEKALSLDARPVYYTTRNFDRDVCTEFADFKGLNLLGRKVENIKSFTSSLEKDLNVIKKSTGKPLFISDYGLSIENENRNGAQNIHSIEAQAEYIVETYKAISNKFFINVISSYADWNAERPLNYPQNYNNFLQTNGVFTIYREPKQAALYIKRLINNQDTPQILEGNPAEDNSQIFLITGVLLCLGLIIIVFNVRKFQDYAAKSLLRPTNFFQFASEQMIIPVTLNILLAILISLGIGLYFSSVSYFYRENIQFDMFLANIFASDGLKIFFSNISNEPLYSIIVFSLMVFIFQVLVTFLIFSFTFFVSGRTYFRNIFTITVWSALQMVIFLPIGTIIFKLAQEDTEYVYISLILFLLLLVFYIIRLIKGARTVYDLSFLKAYGYGIILFLLTFGSLFSYFYFFRHTQYVISLLNSYLKG